MGKQFQELEVWRKSSDFYIKLVSIIKDFPLYKKHCIIDQIMRATLSISNNIAEGSGRNSNKNLVYFLYLSFGSAKEVESMLLISRRLNYLSEKDFNELNLELIAIEKMLFSFIKSIYSSETNFSKKDIQS